GRAMNETADPVLSLADEFGRQHGSSHGGPFEKRGGSIVRMHATKHQPAELSQTSRDLPLPHITSDGWGGRRFLRMLQTVGASKDEHELGHTAPDSQPRPKIAVIEPQTVSRKYLLFQNILHRAR